jgi:hypothetical protein
MSATAVTFDTRVVNLLLFHFQAAGETGKNTAIRVMKCQCMREPRRLQGYVQIYFICPSGLEGLFAARTEDVYAQFFSQETRSSKYGESGYSHCTAVRGVSSDLKSVCN